MCKFDPPDSTEEVRTTNDDDLTNLHDKTKIDDKQCDEKAEEGNPTTQTPVAPHGPVRHWITDALVAGLVAPVRLYQIVISPMLPPMCRFTPTCSQYAIIALRKHGPLKGVWMSIRRIFRCHPWNPGGYDPP